MLRIGHHTSIAGGLENAWKEENIYGGNTCQIFTKSPRSNAIPPFDSDYLTSLLPLRKQYNQIGWIVHSNYIANLSKPYDQALVEIAGIIHDIKVWATLGYDCVNVHIGKWKDRTIDEAMTNMAHNMEYILKQTRDYSIQLCFENTAWQGSELGSNLEEMSLLYNWYIKDLWIKFVIDTAHCQWWWIDCNHWSDYIDQFDTTIWIDQLYAVHLNDSKAMLGSRLDRHAPLGKWCIWLPWLAQVIRWCASHERMMICETPDPSIWKEECEMVRKIITDSFDIDSFHRTYFMTDILKKFENMKSEWKQGGTMWLFG